MIKKKIIFLFIFLLLYSCGKKSDPNYNAKKSEISISKNIV